MKIHKKILAKAQEYRGYTAEILAEMVKIPSYSAQEEAICQMIAATCKGAGFDDVRIDGLGNVVARIGNGSKEIAFDAHIDTVEVGDESQWEFEPFSG